jgi:hypothetical protein
MENDREPTGSLEHSFRDALLRALAVVLLVLAAALVAYLNGI